MPNKDKHLQKRHNGRWHYVRRVPGKYTDFDKRGVIRKGLDTSSIKVATVRRDRLVEADDQYWAAYPVLLMGFLQRV